MTLGETRNIVSEVWSSDVEIKSSKLYKVSV